MYARNDDYSYTGCNDYSEEGDTADDDDDDDGCITLNYDDFNNRQYKSSLWSEEDEYIDEECNSDEQIFQRRDHNYYQRYYTPSTSKSESGGRHSCFQLKDGHCYLDPSVYDTKVMRNLTTMDDYQSSRGNYSPRFIQAALENTESLTSWSGDSQVSDFTCYDNQEIHQSPKNYYDHYSQPRTPLRQIFQAARFADLKTTVENLIYDTQVVIFSKTYCPYCVTAKDIFDDLDQPYTILELDQRADGDQIQEILKELTGGASVPRVFINGLYIGGGDDVKRLYENGKLQEILDIK